MGWETRSVVDQRLEFCRLCALEDANVSQLCLRFGISRQTGYVWLKPVRSGEAAQGRSRRPHSSPCHSGPSQADRNARGRGAGLWTFRA
ncbi:leucine zipper domain-containing protein [Martelella mediterranea]|uniref:leucine zipper domain-containing protein n=1 Tax=Martelella mediterranea TaxID=293089 RepID=UPI001E4F18C6|nr:leucine zipper domain-containing protein [Martelella mediterranea]